MSIIGSSIPSTHWASNVTFCQSGIHSPNDKDGWDTRLDLPLSYMYQYCIVRPFPFCVCILPWNHLALINLQWIRNSLQTVLQSISLHIFSWFLILHLTSLDCLQVIIRSFDDGNIKLPYVSPCISMLAQIEPCIIVTKSHFWHYPSFTGFK